MNVVRWENDPVRDRLWWLIKYEQSEPRFLVRVRRSASWRLLSRVPCRGTFWRWGQYERVPCVPLLRRGTHDLRSRS